MSLYLLPQAGAMLVHRYMPAGPTPCLQPMTPSREHLVVCVEGLGTCATASAGQRFGTAGTKSGQASLQGTFAEAAGLCLRTTPQGQTSRAREENTHGKGQAFTVRAQKLARAVASMFQRAMACGRPHVLQSASGAERVPPTPPWTHAGCA